MQRLAGAWAASILDEALLDDATQIVRSELLRRGYVRPMVSARVMLQGDVKTLHIDVQPGDRGSATRVRIESAGPSTSLGASAVVEDLEMRVRERRLDEEALRNPGAVTQSLTDYLRSRGYLRASVKAAAPLYEDDAAVLPIAVDPGPQFVLATIAFEGRGNVPEDDIARLFDATSGSPYDPAAIDTARERIVALYRSRGFASAAVTANAAIRSDEPRVDLTFEINEGLRQAIGDIALSGSAGVDADVVTRALRLTVGSTLEPTELLRARTRLFDTGLFRRVDVSTEPMPRISATDPVQPMRIRVALEAWPALRLRYGFQVAEERPESDPTGRTLTPGLSTDITRRTLFGRAVSLSGVLQYARRENTARGVLNAPTLMTLPVQSSLVLERVHRTLEGTTSVSDRNGMSWEQRVRTGGHLTLSYSYRFDRDHTFNSNVDPITGTRFDLTVNVARLIGNAAWDTRDDPLNATRGSLFASSLQWAPDRLGSQFRFIKYVGQAYRFQNVHGMVLASAARLGLVTPLGGQDLIFSERFFAGGSRTVRGVDENSLGPRDFFGDPAGGQAMIVLNQEARVPIYKWLGGVAFIDAGNIYRQPRDLRLNNLTGSVGIGVRLSTPFALLRADYGRTTWGAGLHTGRWIVGIGQAF
jgi:outer membrane protein insertion porin family